MSKFSPVEFWESVRYYQGTSSPIDACKKDKGISKAWMHHKGRNSHHYEYWVDNFDQGGEPKQMPYKDAVEMLCDYLGAGRAYMGKSFTYQKEYEWWQKKCEKPLAMNEQTKDFIGLIMLALARCDKEPPNKVAKFLLDPNYLSVVYYDIAGKNPIHLIEVV
jgi:hypothetical protein